MRSPSRSRTMLLLGLGRVATRDDALPNECRSTNHNTMAECAVAYVGLRKRRARELGGSRAATPVTPEVPPRGNFGWPRWQPRTCHGGAARARLSDCVSPHGFFIASVTEIRTRSEERSEGEECRSRWS